MGIPSNLSGDARSRGRDGTRKGARKVSPASRRATRRLLPPACRACGVELERSSGREYCGDCYREHRRDHELMLAVTGLRALAKFRESGDPAKRAEARRKIGEKTAARNRERAAWDRVHGRQDPERFRTEILPMLADVSAGEIAAATGLSRNFAATIKSGKHVRTRCTGTPSRDW